VFGDNFWVHFFVTGLSYYLYNEVSKQLLFDVALLFVVLLLLLSTVHVISSCAAIAVPCGSARIAA
jgi:hypothetical protein